MPTPPSIEEMTVDPGEEFDVDEQDPPTARRLGDLTKTTRMKLKLPITSDEQTAWTREVQEELLD